MKLKEKPEITGLQPLIDEVAISKQARLKDERVTSEMFQKTQLIDLLILILISLGTALCYHSYNNEFEGNHGFFTVVFLLFNLGLSVICCVLVVMRENLYLLMSKTRGTAKATDNLASTGRYKIVIGECFLILV